jgi:hypothetical protein
MPSRRILLISFIALCSLLLTWLTALAASAYTHPLRGSSLPSPVSSPTYDPLAIPTLPANPTQFDLGQNLYFYNCMPCHGDTGQGLTDAFRMVWEDDHRNCWERGCHGGRPQDEGFPVPTVVPAIISPADLLAEYPDLESLVDYLHETHPPQRPGKLKPDEYRALAVFLWVSNNRLLPAGSDSSQAVQPSPIPTDTPRPASPTSTQPATPSAPALPVVASPPPPAAAALSDTQLLILACIGLLGSFLLIFSIVKRSHRLDHP